jgi:hypothetical protein
VPDDVGAGSPSERFSWPTRDRDQQPVTAPRSVENERALSKADQRAILDEIRQLRSSLEERLRRLNHRLDAIDTDVLRLVTIVRALQDADRKAPSDPPPGGAGDR